jgi:hypothetical protein
MSSDFREAFSGEADATAPNMNRRQMLSLSGIGGAAALAFTHASTAAVARSSAQLPNAPYVTAQDYGAVGDGRADDTAAIQAAIAALSPVRRVLYFPPGRYRVTSTLQISGSFYHFLGHYGGRAMEASALAGSELVFEGNGPLFQIGTDNGHPWDANEYDGPQGTRFENLWMSTAPSKWSGALGSLNGTLHYAAGTYGIRDWRGGDVSL